MKTKLLAGLGLAAALVSGCAGQATNSDGQGATVVVHAGLRPGLASGDAVALSRRMSDLPGVAYSDFTPGQGLSVGVRASSDVRGVETALRADPEVVSVSTAPAR